MPRKTVRKRIGPVLLEHATILVQPGKMEEATAFFVGQLGWIELAHRRSKEDGGSIGVVRPATTFCPVTIRLKESKRDKDEPWEILPAAHLGFRVFDAEHATSEILGWACYAETACHTEKVEDGRVLVTLGDIFVTGFEFISISA